MFKILKTVVFLNSGYLFCVYIKFSQVLKSKCCNTYTLKNKMTSIVHSLTFMNPLIYQQLADSVLDTNVLYS